MANLSNFLKDLPSDWEQMAAGDKFPWEGGLTGVMSSTLGISEGDLSSTSRITKHLPASSQEELKLVRTKLRDSAVRARDQIRVFDEAATRVDNLLGNNLPQKRSSELENPSINARGNTLSMLHAPNNRHMSGLAGATQSEDKDVQISDSADGWEKARVKKKRSEIKYGVPTSAITNRLVDDDLKTKRDTQQKLSSNIGSRRSTAQTFRSGISNSVAKWDVTSRNAGHGIGMCSARKEDHDNGAHLNDRRDHMVASEKERFTMKTSKRSSPSPSSTTPTNSVTRGLHSSSCPVPKASPSVRRSIGVNGDCEPSQSSNKLHTVSGAKNSEHTSQARSSSPPLAQWACKRSQKSTRVARRPNLVPPAPGHDETPMLGIDSNISSSDTAFRFNGRLSGNPPQQVTSKTDRFTSVALSEIKESGASKRKFMYINKISGEIDEKSSQNARKGERVSPSTTNTLLDEDLGLGSGVRKQGRTARGSDNMSSGHRMSIEKRESAGTVEQLRSSTLSFNNNGSKTSHSTTRKLTKGRGRTRTRNSVNAEISDMQDDGHEELLAAATSAVNTAHACSGKFWKQSEPIFGFVSSDDIAYIKQQGETPCEDDDDDHVFTSGAEKLIQQKRDCNVPSLFQRVLSALITEEEVELTGDSLTQQSCTNIQAPEKPTSTGYKTPTTDGYLADIREDTDQTHITSVVCTQTQYDQMSLDERLLLELQSLGLCSELPEDEETTEQISGLQKQLQKQLSKKRESLQKLETSVVKAKELQERDIEHRAFDKLVGIAYEKYKSCRGRGRGRNACYGKGKSVKITRQAALSFVKQTIERCQKFDNRKESCFNKPAYMDILHSVPPLVKIAEEREETSAIPQKSSEVIQVIDLLTPPLPDVDLLGGGEQDLASWLGNDEECQDSDGNGLAIPMDNLYDLNLTP